MDKVVKNSLNVEVPMNGFVDEGDGIISFPQGLTITDGSVQRNQTTYDIDTLDITKYGRHLTGDHEDKLSSLIGRVEGVEKLNGKVIVNRIVYAIKENPYARLAYDLLRGGFSSNFSTETLGPSPDHNGIWWNSELVGLSQVVTQNNYNAKINQVVHNSLEMAKQDGLDVTGIEEKFTKNSVEKETNMEETKETETKITETETKPVAETPVVAPVADEQSTKVEAPVVEPAKEEEAKVTETKVEETTQTQATVEEPKEEVKTVVETPQDQSAPVGQVQTEEKAIVENKETNNKEDKMEDKKVETPQVDTNALSEAIANAVAAALKPVHDELKAVREEATNAFNASAKEPEFQKEENGAPAPQKQTNKYADMDWKERHGYQVAAAYNAVKLQDAASWATLNEINSVNLNELKKAGIAENAMTLADLGNFVIAPEMYNEIQGQRNDYTPLLNATEWRETLSLEFAWLQRTGDIDMRNVAFHATNDDADANLKPISEYSATPKKSELEELAAVTVVANSATRFAAVDLLQDAAAGYRSDFDRKRAQLVIALLERAVDSTGNSAAYTPTGDAGDMDSLVSILDTITSVSDTTLNGTLVMNARTFARIKSHALRVGANGPLSEILTTGNLPTLFGYGLLIVPNDLMPSLGGGETVAHEVHGTPVAINHAVYFADLNTFTGRTSGGLQYDVSSQAGYEVGGVTRSSFQRNELVLRGSFFRGGAVRDVNVVAGIRMGAGANVS